MSLKATNNRIIKAYATYFDKLKNYPDIDVIENINKEFIILDMKNKYLLKNDAEAFKFIFDQNTTVKYKGDRTGVEPLEFTGNYIETDEAFRASYNKIINECMKAINPISMKK